MMKSTSFGQGKDPWDKGREESRPTLRGEMLLWRPAPVNPKTPENGLLEGQTVSQSDESSAASDGGTLEISFSCLFAFSLPLGNNSPIVLMQDMSGSAVRVTR